MYPALARAAPNKAAACGPKSKGKPKTICKAALCQRATVPAGRDSAAARHPVEDADQSVLLQLDRATSGAAVVFPNTIVTTEDLANPILNGARFVTGPVVLEAADIARPAVRRPEEICRTPGSAVDN